MNRLLTPIFGIVVLAIGSLFITQSSSDPSDVSGSRPKNLDVTSNGTYALTTSMGGDDVILMKRSGGTWVRVHNVNVGGKTWGVCWITDTDALVTLPHENYIQWVTRSGDVLTAGPTITAPYYCTEIIKNNAGTKVFVANRGIAPSSGKEWQNSVLEYTVDGGTHAASLSATLVTDREPRVLALSPDENRLFVGHVQGALGGKSWDALSSAEISDVTQTFAFDTQGEGIYDGGSILAFDVNHSSGSYGHPVKRIPVGSPVRGLAIFAGASNYTLFFTSLGAGAQAEDPDFGGRDIPNVISSEVFGNVSHDFVGTARQDMVFNHEPDSDGSQADLPAVLPEKLLVRQDVEPAELWVINSGSGTACRTQLGNDGRLVQSQAPAVQLHIRRIKPNTRTPFITNASLDPGEITVSLPKIVYSNTADIWDLGATLNDFTSGPSDFAYDPVHHSILIVTELDQTLVEIGESSGQYQVIARQSLIGGLPGDNPVGTDEKNFFTFGRGFDFREDSPELQAKVNNITCGSCHVDGHIDGKVRFIVRDPRNTPGVVPDGSVKVNLQGGAFKVGKPVTVPSIFDVGKTEWIFHEGFKTILDDEAQPGNGGCVYCANTGFFDDTVDFTNSISSPISPSAPSGALTATARHGRFLFEAMNCSRCHSGPIPEFKRTNTEITLEMGPLPASLTTSNPLLHDPTQVFVTLFAQPPPCACEDPGDLDDMVSLRNLTDVGTRQTMDGNLMGINTPALAGLWDNRPYMHDGRYRTLDEVLKNTWLIVGSGNTRYRAAAYQEGLSNNAMLAIGPSHSDPFSVECAIGPCNITPTPELIQFDAHENRATFSGRISVYDYLNSTVGGSAYADFREFLNSVSSQTSLCGSGADAAQLITNIQVATSGGTSTLSWTTAVPIECDVNWGTQTPPETNGGTTSHGTSHSVLLNGILSGTAYHADITAHMRTVCGENAKVSFSWTPIPDIEAPASVAFGNVSFPLSSTRQVTISNTGTGTLDVSAMELTAYFTWDGPGSSFQPVSIDAGSSFVCTLRFTPEFTGMHYGTLTITSNDPDESPLTVSLQGKGQGYFPGGAQPPIEALPTVHALRQSVPNPTKMGATIAFDLPAQEFVRLDVFDLQGRLVRTLVDGVTPAGRHEADWNGQGTKEERVPPGIYFYRIKTPSFEDVKKLLVVP